MGSDESQNLDSNDNITFKIKNEVSDNRGTIDDEAMIEYLEKAKYATCKIEINDSKYGSGFFCKIPSKDNGNILIDVLLTNEHVLDYNYVFSKSDLKLVVNNKEKIISLKEERKRWSNKTLDYSCIEILKQDNIKDFYCLDDKILKDDYSNDIYLGKNIIIFGIMKNKKRGHSDGLIKYINKFYFVHNCNTYPGCSGAVIVNKNNNLVIGIHKGELETNKILNVGIFLKNILEDIKKDKSKTPTFSLKNKIEIIKEYNISNDDIKSKLICKNVELNEIKKKNSDEIRLKNKSINQESNSKNIIHNSYNDNNIDQIMIKFEQNEIKQYLNIKKAKFFEIDNIKITNIGKKNGFKTLWMVIDTNSSSHNLLFMGNSKRFTIHNLTLDGPLLKGDSLNNLITLYIQDPKIEEYTIFIYIREKPDGDNLSPPLKITVILIEDPKDIKRKVEEKENIDYKGVDKNKVKEIYSFLEDECNISSILDREEVINKIIELNCDEEKINNWLYEIF